MPDSLKFQLIAKLSTLTTEKLSITITMMNLKSLPITWNSKNNTTPSWMPQPDSKECPLNSNKSRRISKKLIKDSQLQTK